MENRRVTLYKLFKTSSNGDSKKNALKVGYQRKLSVLSSWQLDNNEIYNCIVPNLPK